MANSQASIDQYIHLPPKRVLDRQFRKTISRIILLSFLGLAIIFTLISALALNLTFVTPAVEDSNDHNNKSETSNFNPFARFIPWTMIIWFTGFTLLCIISWKNLDFCGEARSLYLQRKQQNVLQSETNFEMEDLKIDEE